MISRVSPVALFSIPAATAPRLDLLVSRIGGNVGNRIKGKVHANNDGRFGSVYFNDENGLCVGEVTFPEWMSKKQRKRIASEICAQFPLSIFAIQGLPADHPKVIEFKKRFVDG